MCPSLLIILFYYVSFVDYDSVDVSIFYKVIIASSTSFLFVAIFNEVWLLSTLVYIPLISYFMYISGKDMLNYDKDYAKYIELIVRIVYLILVFAIFAY